MTIISIEEAGKYEGQEVTIRGWLYNLRESGKLMFPIFRDGTGIIQGVCALKENPEAFEALKGLTQESSVIVTGKIRAEQRAPGGFEMGVSKIQVLQRVSEAQPYPIQLKEHGVDFLLDHRHLWIRTPRQAAILRIRAEAIRAARNFMDSQGYILTDAPMFTPAACEGTSTLFEVNYIDDQKAYLTQSGQLYIEATAMALGKVYTFGPTFRSEEQSCALPICTSTLFEVNYIDDQKAYLTQSGQLYIEATAMALGKVYTFGPTFRAEKSKTRR